MPIEHPAGVLVKNVRIFDGVSGRLSDGHVLVEGSTIAAVETSPIAEVSDATVIDGAGRVLMPGMSDAHVHLVGMANTMPDLMTATQTQLAAATLARAKDTLLPTTDLSLLADPANIAVIMKDGVVVKNTLPAG